MCPLRGQNVVKDRLPAPAPRYCRICGDTALNFNFNVLSCESCKSFFRRNARRPDERIHCPYENKCIITATSRRCTRCRLAKCFAVGQQSKNKCKVKKLCRLECARRCFHQKIVFTSQSWMILPVDLDHGKLKDNERRQR